MLKWVRFKHDMVKSVLLQADMAHMSMVAIVCTYEEYSTSAAAGQADLLRFIHVRFCNLCL